MASVKAIAAIALTLIVAVPICLGYGFASTEVEGTSWESTETTNVTDLLYNTSKPYYTTYVGTTNNSMFTNDLLPAYVSTGDTVTSYPAAIFYTVEVTFPRGNPQEMSDYMESDETWAFTLTSGSCTVSDFTYGDDGSISGGAIQYTADYGARLVTGTADAEVTFTTGTYNYITVSVYTGEYNYADITAGWKLPAGQCTWLNNQTNGEVTFSIYLPSGASVEIGVYTATNTDGTVTVTWSQQGMSETYTLGKYSYIQWTIGAEKRTISGLSGWPEYGTAPTLYNTLEFDGRGSTFANITIVNEDQTAVFRVDSAQIVAGTYPMTHNYGFMPYNYYPEQSYIFTIKSVAEYGTALNIVNRENGVTTGNGMDVTDGTVTYNGTTMKVRGLKISVLENSDGTWNAYVNNELFWENLEYQPYIDIWGWWSLTASYDTVESVTTSTQAWAPGEFAFEKEDFAACGMLVAGICLVGLGMTGPKSGTKIGVLLMICGGAGLIYLNLI